MYQVIAQIDNIIVLKVIGEKPELIIGSVIPVSFGEPVEEEEPEFNR